MSDKQQSSEQRPATQEPDELDKGRTSDGIETAYKKPTLRKYTQIDYVAVYGGDG